jgi:transcriptional regulator with XRE-family HTH domain
MTENLGQKIRWLRLERNMTQQDLAYAVRIRHESVSRIERGAINPTSRTVSQLAEALSVSEDELTSNQL